ncbi:MAG: electron transfer flavoprotein-ubiquinone oxidoreductase [Deltaproteobacteria bacterium]|jgi:electron-transferring-flavoprotein dehydrogenase|nr:electron transfer flavoprotein-ubiquinone oxidoreductase [Deltaproteobacteria bacterium]MBW2481949.1 electron transfer flavoprotein-ubiquinone oxidoreductase [Deltaproteobacteria bacterium]
MEETREALEFDVLFVGGGPANLAGAIHLMNLAQQAGKEIEVCLIEKAESIGSHSLSGAIMDPVALKELMPDYLDKGCPIETAECRDEFYYLTPTGKLKVPYTPGYMHNDGCHIISLSKYCAWLGEQAEALGVMVFPGFAGTEILYDGDRVIGIRTGDKGVDKDGNKRPNFEPGVDLMAKVTVFGEGPKGSLLRELGKKLGIFDGKMPQVFETAVKEVIEIPESSPFVASKTTVLHSFGYPLGLNTKGGGFLYKMKDNRVALGFVVGLEYENPLLEPYQAFLNFKKHPLIAGIIAGGKVLQQGAKTLPAGGYYSMPRLAVDGALIVGDSASMLNIQRLKGVHTATKSGMLGAETIMAALESDDYSAETLGSYQQKIDDSWIKKELFAARNFGQALSQKGFGKFITIGAQYLTGGRGLTDPMPIEEDSASLKKVSDAAAAEVPAEVQNLDGKLYLDKLTGLYLSGTTHEENQPCHLVIPDTNLCVTDCYENYRCPCTLFCPAQVYELEEESDGTKRIKLNPSNCLHCKTCEIKDPYKNIVWTCPEGGGGPKYSIV